MTAVSQWFRTERTNLKVSKYAGQWATVTFIHFLKGLWSMWKQMVNTGGVINVFVYVSPSSRPYLCFTLIYFLWNEAPDLVALCNAVKTRIARMCPIPTPSKTRYVMLGFHSLICKRACQPPSSCCCKNKINSLCLSGTQQAHFLQTQMSLCLVHLISSTATCWPCPLNFKGKFSPKHLKKKKKARKKKMSSIICTEVSCFQFTQPDARGKNTLIEKN